MGLLDELKKLTKPYDDEDYLEEDLAEPVRVPGAAPEGRGYAAYAEPPRQPEQGQTYRRPYVFSQPAAQTYAQTGYEGGAYPGGYAQRQGQQPYATRGGAAPGGYAAQTPAGGYGQSAGGGYGQSTAGAYPQSAPGGYAGAPQAKLLLVRPDRFEVAADIADRISERNAIVLNLETTPKETTRRLLDFLSGVTYALSGKIKKVSGSTYVITPSGMDFMGDGLEEMETKGNYF